MKEAESMNQKESSRVRENPKAAAEDSHSRIELTDRERSEFQKVYQAGIYRELYQRNLLTEYQLSELLNRLSGSCTCDPEGWDLW